MHNTYCGESANIIGLNRGEWGTKIGAMGRRQEDNPRGHGDGAHEGTDKGTTGNK